MAAVAAGGTSDATVLGILARVVCEPVPLCNRYRIGELGLRLFRCRRCDGGAMSMVPALSCDIVEAGGQANKQQRGAL